MKKLSVFIYGLAFCLQTAHAQLVFNSLDLFPGAGKSGNPTQLTASGSYLFFTSTLTSNGTELWKTDGTIINTFMVKDLYPGSVGSDPKELFDYNGRLLFTATDGITGDELWATTGTAASTVLIKDIIFGNFGSQPGQYYLYNGKVLFTTTTFAEGVELWITDGTTGGTQLVKDINPGSMNSNITAMCTYNNKVFFSAEDGVHNVEPWFSDGSDTGTHLLKDIIPGGVYGSVPRMFIEYKGILYFGINSIQGNTMCKTDGTTMGTLSSNSVGVRDNNFAIVFNNELYLNGPELYKYNGTTPTVVKEFVPGAGGAILYSPVILDNKLYFIANTPAEGNELWVTDGTTAGTVLVKDIIPGSAGSNPTNLFAYRHHLYFTATDASGNRDVYQTDGTTANTVPVAPPGGNANAIDSATFTGFAVYNGSLHYAAEYDAIGRELWWLTDTTTYPPPASAETILQPSFSLYPNPNDGTFTVQLDNTHFKTGSVSVYNMMGQQIHQSSITNSKFPITLNNTPKGIYLVKLQMDDAVLTRRVTIE